MKIFYVLDSNGTIKSSDGIKTYKLLKGSEVKAFLMSEQGKKRRFDIRKDKRGNFIGIEIPPSIYKRHEEERNREKYLKKVREALDISELSIESMLLKDGEGSGEELLADAKQDLEALVIAQEEKLLLMKAMKYLKPLERFVIEKLYLIDDMSGAELAVQMGLSRQYINQLQRNAIHKLKKLLSIWMQ